MDNLLTMGALLPLWILGAPFVGALIMLAKSPAPRAPRAPRDHHDSQSRDTLRQPSPVMATGTGRL